PGGRCRPRPPRPASRPAGGTARPATDTARHDHRQAPTTGHHAYPTTPATPGPPPRTPTPPNTPTPRHQPTPNAHRHHPPPARPNAARPSPSRLRPDATTPPAVANRNRHPAARFTARDPRTQYARSSPPSAADTGPRADTGNAENLRREPASEPLTPTAPAT